MVKRPGTMAGEQRLWHAEHLEAITAVQTTTTSENDRDCTVTGPIQVLVVSQHDMVRRQLVAYLQRSASLSVSGDELSSERLVLAHPDVLVLDLSQIDPRGLGQAL